MKLNKDNKLLIMHVIVGLDVGGAEMMLKRLIDQGVASNYRHVVVSLTKLGEVGQQLQSSGVVVYVLGMCSVLGVPATIWKLMRIIRALHPDIVQTWMYHADLLGGLAARLVGHKLIIWGVRTTDVRAGGSRATLMVRRMCAWMSHWLPKKIICAAEESLRVHVELGYDADRMLVVPNGFDLKKLNATDEQRQALRLSCGFTPDSIVIGSLGRFSRVKDHETFVRSAGILAEKYPSLSFLLIGRDLVPGNVELSTWIKQTGHEDRFVLLGERSDVPVCLSAMDVFCLHSRTEGFPNVLGEAMAMGLPCITTDVGDAALLLGDTGMVVAKEDPAALARAMEKLILLSSEERASLGQKARQRIHDDFTLDRTRKRFEGIYNTMMNGSVC